MNVEHKRLILDSNGVLCLQNNPELSKIEITQVSMRQARLALFQMGLLDGVEQYFTTPEQRIWWDYATIVEKTNPVVTDTIAALKLTENQVTELFELAVTL